MGCPAGGVLEETDRPDAAIAAEVEPVVGALRHPDEVASLDFDREHGIVGRMHMEQPASFDDEADLVFIRLQDIGLRTVTLSDEELGVSNVKRVRSMTFGDIELTIHQAGGIEDTYVAWTDMTLILPGRLFETRLEIMERMTRKTENDILDTSEFFRDEAVIDFYATGHSHTWRVSANGFDFSCLDKEKALIANENIGKLQRLLATRAVNAKFDDSYPRVRSLLELVWTTQAETQSSGWRRERPGKLSVGVATTKSNESQFTRYSRLRRRFVKPQEGT